MAQKLRCIRTLECILTGDAATASEAGYSVELAVAGLRMSQQQQNRSIA